MCHGLTEAGPHSDLPQLMEPIAQIHPELLERIGAVGDGARCSRPPRDSPLCLCFQ
jgi:hypothetical protein